MAEGPYAKERLLKKYEAEARVCASAQGDPALDLYSPFGPMIAKTRLPEALIRRINAYADGVVCAGKAMEFLLPDSLIAQGGEDSLTQHTARLVRRYVAGMEGSQVERVEFEVFWIVSQYAGTPSPVHFHSADISGVLYLKVPQIEAQEEARSYISGRQAGYINFLIGGKQRFSKSLISFKPQVGDFYLFPGWLLHGAEPFRGSGERRSMAFNASLAGAAPG
ncbi:MAG: putative 2OG-Fe(II) oxygenase [Burkholderiales bacterium]|jgi:hypothetical protein